MDYFSKRNMFILFSILLLSVLFAGCSAIAGSSDEIKIGYQKNGTTLTLKNDGELQKELEDLGYTVTWSEFNTGSSILEALNSGSIDFAGAGDIPSIFALDKGSDFKYIASEPSAPTSEGILVSENSDIQSLEDLKGKKVAYNNASIAQYLLTKSLHAVDLSIDDIESVILNPPDASLAFEKGEVDAWVVWDPYLADAESRGNVVLQTAEDIVPYRSFYFATSEITEEAPEEVELFIEHLSQVGKSIDADPTEAAELLEEATKIPSATWGTVLARKQSNVQFIDNQAIEDLQVEAKDLLDIGLINNEIDFTENIWYPENE
ncbi:MAG: aliphatic sulfonate ABC transporter substrate-binding protein [Oceanobacillus sp.]|nr:aliphatic sulfonate ABC transporter substrate-binding protein [Oceanobacillus sp.]